MPASASGDAAGAATPDITVVVVTWNGAHLLPACLDSLRTQTEQHAVVVVDNASSDSTQELLRTRYPEVTVLRLATNTGFAGGAEAGLAASASPFVALLNNDAVADSHWLAALAGELRDDPGLAATTSRMLLARNGRVNNAGGALTASGIGYDRGLNQPNDARFDEPVDVAAFCGGAAMLRAEPARTVGGFSPEFFLYYEDTDLSWRLGRAGYRIRYVPAAVVKHEHSASSDQTSPLFAYYNQRNQLLTLVRNAPARVVLTNLARFVLITVLDVPRALVGAIRHKPLAFQHRPVHRLRVLRDVLRALPAQGAVRRRTAHLPVSRSDFARRWLGVESRPLP